MNFKKLEKHFVIILAVSLVTFFFSTCEIGLGAAVDTEAPNLSILIPNPDKVDVIRGDFPVSGTWSDDGTIASVEVTISSGDKAVLKENAEVVKNENEVGKGSWSYIVSPSTMNLTDGAYGVSVKIKDKAGHFSTASGQIIVDNTEPVVVLQRPSSIVGSSTADAYGQSLSLVGQLADDNGIAKLEMNVYSDAECTQSLLTSPIVLSKITTLDNSVAEFKENEENIYSQIYGTSSLLNETRVRYFTLTTYDGSIHYNTDGSEQTDADKLGNVSTVYYLYNNISDVISNYTISDIYHMKNGSYSTSDTARSAATSVLSVLEESQEGIGQFSLNPSNNPTFNVSGKEQLPADTASYADFFANKNKSYISNKSTVQVEVSPGLDGVALDSNLQPYAQLYENGTYGTKYPLKIVSTKKSGSSYKIETYISTEQGLSIGKNYIFGVSGADTDGKAVVATGSGYGFHLASSGEAPVVNASISPASGSDGKVYRKADGTITISGTVQFEEEGTLYILLNDKLLVSATGSNHSAFTKYEQDTSVTTNKKYNFEYTYSAFSDEGSYIFDVYGDEESISSAKTSFHVIYDTSAPTVSIDEITPVAALYKTNSDKAELSNNISYLNGIASITISVDDNYARQESGDYAPKLTIGNSTFTMTKFPSQTFQFDTTKIADGTDVVAKVVAYDLAGNKSEKSGSTYKISQETDKPVILPYYSSSTSFLFANAETANSDENKNYFLSGGDTVYFKILDDDDSAGTGSSLKQISVVCTPYSKETTSETDDEGKPIYTYNPGSSTTVSANEFYKDASGNTTDWAYQYAMPDKAGVYKLSVTVTDNVLSASQTKEFFLKVKASAPKVSMSIESPESKYITTASSNVTTDCTKTLTTKLVINSDQIPFKITRKITGSGVTYEDFKDESDSSLIEYTESDLTNTSAGYEWTDENIDLSQIAQNANESALSGSYKIQYKVYDTNKNFGTSAATTFYVDTEAPVISNIMTPSVEETEQSTYTFDFTSTDMGSGNKYYKIGFASCDDENGTNPSAIEYVSENLDKNSYTLTFANSSVFTSSGYKSVYIYAVDKVGNTGEASPARKTFIYDKALPVITINAPVKQGTTNVLTESEDNSEESPKYNTGAAFSLSGSVSDDWKIDDTKDIILKQTKNYDGLSSSISIIVTPDADGNWTVGKLPKATANATEATIVTGKYEYVLTAYDSAGKVSSSKTYSIEIDKDAPTLGVSAVSSILSGSSQLFSGTAGDVGLGIASVKYVFKKIINANESVPAESEYTSEAEYSSGYWSFTKTLAEGNSGSEAAPLYEGRYKLYVMAIDKAGNKTDNSASPVEFYVDKAIPEITDINLNVSSSDVKDMSADETTYYKLETASDITLTGTIKESNGLNTVTAESGTTSLTVALGNQTDSGTYGFTITVPSAIVAKNDELVSVKIVLKDVANQTTPKTYKIYNDTTKPSVEITNPAADDSTGAEAISGDQYIFTVDITDSASGIKNKKFNYGFDNPICSSEAIVSDGNWKITKTLGTGTSGSGKDLYEGEHHLYIKASDSVGNEETAERVFWIDQANPTLSCNDISASEGAQIVDNVPVVNTGFELSGTAGDTNSLASVEIKEGTSSLKTITSFASNGWSHSFELGDSAGKLADGRHTFTIIATDVVGKTTTAEKTVIVDTVAPSGSMEVKTSKVAAISSKDWYNTQNIEISVNANDSTSGIYQVRATSDDSATANAAWITLSPSGNEYKGSVYCANQGSNTIRVEIIDNAGKKYSSLSKTVYIDTESPDVTSGALISVDDSKNASDLSGQKLVNGRNYVTIVMTIKDANEDSNAGSGIASVVLKKPLANLASGVTSIPASLVENANNQWTVTIPAANLGTGTVVYEVTDKVGKKATYTTGLSIYVDNKAPEIKKTTLPDYVNGKISLSGTVYDVRGVATVDVCYYVDTSVEFDLDGDSVKDNKKWIPIYHGTSENWDVTDAIDTKALSNAGVPDGTEIYIVPVVVDTAGNCNLDTGTSPAITVNHEQTVGTGDSAVTYNVPKSTITPSVISDANKSTLKLDQDSDRPVITLDGLKFKEGTTFTMAGANPIKSSVNNFTGSVSDDDGVKKLEYKLDDASWVEVTLTNSAFTINGIADGTHTVLFKVTDNADGTFETSEDASKTGIKLTDGTNKLAYTTAESTALYLKVDVTDPSIDSIKYRRTTSAEYADYTKETFGGDANHRMIYLQVGASDTNGISMITVTLDKDSGDKVNGVALDDSRYSSIVDDPENGIGNFVFDVANMVSGNRNITVTVSDGIKETTNTYPIVIDNEAPTVNVTSHSVNQLILKSFLLRGEVKGSDTGTVLKYIISKSATVSSWNDAVPVSNIAAGVWQIYFDKDSDTASVADDTGYTHDSNPKHLVTRLTDTVEINSDGAVVYKAGQANAGQKYTVTDEPYYIHFHVTDSYGNKAEKNDFSLYIDANGDTPIVSLSNPQKEIYGWWKQNGSSIEWYQASENNWGSDSKETAPATGYTYAGPAALMSGIIRTSGTATAENGLKAVYMQIDPSYDPSVGFSSTWNTDELPNTNYSGGISGSDSALGYTIESFGKNNDRYGIRIGTNQTWNLSLNGKSEFEKEGSSNIIAIRLYAVDNKDNVSSSENDIFLIRVDSGAPRVGSSERLMLRQYDTSGNVTAVKEYTEGMWLKGKWYLEGSVEDESGISAITVGSLSIIGEGTFGEAGWKNGVRTSSANSSDNTTHGYLLKYLIGNDTDDAGEVSFKINVTDNQSKNYAQTISYKYDNKAPVLEGVTGSNYNISKDVKNSDGFYTVQSGASEGRNESGFSMAVFYFKRTVSGYQKIYDSYIKKGATGNALSYTGTSANVEQGAEGLWWRKSTVVSGGINGSNVTLEDANPNVHTGGLAKLGGVVYRIESYDINTKIVTLEGNPDESLVSGKTCDIFFVIGHVVDKEGSETAGSRGDIITDDQIYGYYKNTYNGVTSDDDGDHMIEVVSTNDTVTKWAGSINSNNIPDGPIEIHYVVFDKAGNYNSGSVESGAYVKNNAPRLAGLTVKSGSEEDTFYYGGLPRVINGQSLRKATGLTDRLVVSGNKKDADDNGSAFMTVKDAIDFTPELVGGNGDLYYSFYVVGATGQTGVASKDSPTEVNTSFGSGNSDGIDDYADTAGSSNAGYYLKDSEGSEYYTGHNVGTINFTTDQLKTLKANSSAAAPTWFYYTIWDSTDGTEKFVNSLNVSFECALNVQYFDMEAPFASITPLYWTSSTNNSLYNNSRDNGHIELKDDLTPTLKDSPYGTGDKVSGKITMRGTATDNIHVSSLWVKIDGFSTFSDYVNVANYTNSAWVPVVSDTTDNMTNYSWTCKVTDVTDITDEDVAAGKHKIKWEFSFDTEKIGVAKDCNFYFKVQDEASKRGSSSNNSSREQTYTIDVVPYITRVVTSLSSIQADDDSAMYGTNASVYDRTALGHYPVYYVTKVNDGSTITVGGETVELKGFNLGTNTSYSVGADSSSGEYKVTVSGIDSINNINSSREYNMLPNNDSNNNLTDDLVFDVWQFNSAAAITGTGKAGGKISQPVMAINPVNDKIGFAFVNGQYYASMANGSSNSYDTWIQSRDFCTSIAMTYDSLGHTFGTVAGGDVDNGILDKYNFTTSLWGKPGKNAYRTRNGYRTLRLESIGSGTSGNLIFEKQRIMSPSIKTTVHNNSDTNIYLAYYDSQDEQVKFRSGTIDVKVLPVDYYDYNGNNYTYGHITLPSGQEYFKDGTELTFCDASGNEITKKDVYQYIGLGDSGVTYYASKVGRFGDSSTDYWFTISKESGGQNLEDLYSEKSKSFWNGTYTEENGLRYPDTKLYIKLKLDFGTFADIEKDQSGDSGKRESTCQLIADKNYSDGKAGSFVSIDVVSGSDINNDVVVATWYSSDRKLWYSYNESPLTNRVGTKRDDSNLDDGWSTPVQVFTGDLASAGQYCKIAVDAKGGIHIAAYDPVNLDVVYAYLPSYDSSSITTMIVDSNGVNGRYLTLDVALNSANDSMAIPYIGYYSNSCLKPKLAYLLDASDLGAGAVNELATGKWEITVIPTPNKPELQSDQYNNINVAVWKTNGLLKTSGINTGKSTSSAANGTCYGNGTKYPVLGYVITDDTIETAQKK